ncbi:MAG: dihydrolipoyl dehydrogenase [Oscillospiraceae bacterium]|nr:dihydrolipoyl dehydrogenase [Oscillospiraceae bacterium]
MDIFDLIVIGGGPGGYLCAERAAQKGMKVALFEERALGGTCLNEGCIPTKTLLNSAKLYRHAKESEAFGVNVGSVSYDHAVVIDRKNAVVKKLVGGVGSAMKAHKVKVISACAKISGRGEDGFEIEADGNTYTAKRIVIATGSETSVPPVPGLKEGLESGFVLTNREALDIKELPKKMAVIGGGVIGLEMAYYFASVGVDITVIEMMPKLAGNTDAEICGVLTEDCISRGMDIKLSCRVLEVTQNGVRFEENGEEKTLSCDRVLLAAGRRPRTAGIGLETLSIETERGAIVTDRHLCTNVSGVYAVGDCNGKLMLAHTAYREAEVAVNHMVGISDEMRYDVIPSVIYTDPEIASVGISKVEAEERGLRVKEIKLPMIYAGRYVAETENGKGFIKLLVDMGANRLIGCSMIGSYASELIITPTIMIDTELPPKRLQRFVFPHPTVAEIIREALFQL